MPAKAGAAVVHVHARDPKDGRPSSDVKVFEQICRGIHEQCDAAICVTTGGGLGMTPEERVKPVGILKPELASLNAGSMNFAIHPLANKIKEPMYDWELPYLKSTEDLIFPNTFRSIKVFTQTMVPGVGTKPELEIYDVGMINNLKYLIDTGVIKTPVYLQFVMGILGGIAATPENLVFMYETARKAIGEKNFVWSCCAAGRMQMPLITLAMIHGRQRPGRPGRQPLHRPRPAREKQCRTGREDHPYRQGAESRDRDAGGSPARFSVSRARPRSAGQTPPDGRQGGVRRCVRVLCHRPDHGRVADLASPTRHHKTPKNDREGRDRRVADVSRRCPPV